MNAHRMMLEVAEVESHCLELRGLACDGSLLKGHTVNEGKAETNKAKIKDELIAIIIKATRAIEKLEG